MSAQALHPVTAARQEASPKRQRVLEAARALFLARGYGAVSMDAVAQRAGVSKATLYAYFQSKDALFATMMDGCSLTDMVEERLFALAPADLPAALTAIGQTVLRFLVRPDILAVFRIAVAESARFPELGQTFHARGPQRFLDRLTEWLVEQQRAGRVRQAADPVVAAQQFAALLRSGLFLRTTLALPPPPTEAEIDGTVAAAVATWLCAYAA
jgi:TetR/AcrR family transcriptional repressor of mexJK operon